eukprot:TRINITY_DN2748_c0_g1_i1.p2 TRINITY_DN2748_c0_g1~~TRINITY_DN2748_c0_g1_i1.p2  ORF type:complete len:110 (-),score=33.07 TRINITY_DN2748_c0_g1_i1:936-1241(-)
MSHKRKNENQHERKSTSQLCEMFPELDRNIVELAVEASRGKIDDAISALLSYVARKEGGSKSSETETAASNSSEISLRVFKKRWKPCNPFTQANSETQGCN